MAKSVVISAELDSKQYDIFMRSIMANIKKRSIILVAARKISAEVTAKRFRDGGQAPHRWPALSDSTIQRRIAKGTWPGAGGSQPILQELGNLKKALLDEKGSKFGAYSRQLGSNQIEFGTTISSASILQSGSQKSNLPARPILYWSRKEVKAITNFAMSFIVSQKRTFVPRGLLS